MLINLMAIYKNEDLIIDLPYMKFSNHFVTATTASYSLNGQSQYKSMVIYHLHWSTEMHLTQNNKYFNFAKINRQFIYIVRPRIFKHIKYSGQSLRLQNLN